MGVRSSVGERPAFGPRSFFTRVCSSWGVAAGQQVLREGKVVKVLRLWINNGDGEEARRQSQRLAEREPQKHWSEQLPDWSDWAA